MTGMIRKNGIALMLLGLLLFACSTKDPRTLTTDSSMTINYEINGERFVIHPPEKYTKLEHLKKQQLDNYSTFKWTDNRDSIAFVSVGFHADSNHKWYRIQMEKARDFCKNFRFVAADSSIFQTEWTGSFGDTIYHNQVTTYSSDRAFWSVSFMCRKCKELDKQFVERIEQGFLAQIFQTNPVLQQEKWR